MVEGGGEMLSQDTNTVPKKILPAICRQDPAGTEW